MGYPVTKLESPEFCDLIERPHEDLGGLNGVKLQLPLVLDHVKEKRNAAVKEKWVVVYFDGSKVNEMIELCVGRYLDDDFDVVQIVLGAKMVGTSLAATGLEALLMDQIRDAGIPIARVVGSQTVRQSTLRPSSTTIKLQECFVLAQSWMSICLNGLVVWHMHIRTVGLFCAKSFLFSSSS
jgi:hypothetical protein